MSGKSTVNRNRKSRGMSYSSFLYEAALESFGFFGFVSLPNQKSKQRETVSSTAWVPLGSLRAFPSTVGFFQYLGEVLPSS